MGRLARSTGLMFFLRQLSSWVNCDDFFMRIGVPGVNQARRSFVPISRRLLSFDEVKEHTAACLPKPIASVSLIWPVRGAYPSGQPILNVS